MKVAEAEFQLQHRWRRVYIQGARLTDLWEIERQQTAQQVNTGAIGRITLSGVQRRAYAAGVGDQDDANPNAVASTAANAEPACSHNNSQMIPPQQQVVDGINIDLSDYFNELSHTTTASVAATAGTPQVLQWLTMHYKTITLTVGQSKTYDQYDGVDGATLGAESPRLVQLQTGLKIQRSAMSKPLNAGYDAVTSAD